ncbi:MAG: hypothetical protein RL885_12265 [Planctomycetota bacterium]
MSPEIKKRPLTWRGWIVPAGAIVLILAAFVIARVFAPGLRLVTPRFDGPEGAAVWIDRQGGPRPIAVGAAFVSGALLGIGPDGARFRIEPGGVLEVAPHSQLRFLNGPDSTTFELLRGDASVSIDAKTPRTILSTKSGAFVTEAGRLHVWTGSPSDEAFQESVRGQAPDLDWETIFAAAERELFLLRLESGDVLWQPMSGASAEGGERRFEAPKDLVTAPGLGLRVASDG